MTASPMRLDRDRFAKCQTLADRGATPGERAAGRAAAARVAASAGMTLEEAMRLVGAASHPSSRPPPPPRPSPTYQPDAAYAHAWRKAKAKPKPKPEPITVAEILAQKAADLERRKKATARQEREDLKLYAEQDAANAIVREQQAARDREWAEARARQQQG